MLKKKKNKKKQILLKIYYKQEELLKTIKKSLFRNHSIHYLNRLSFYVTNNSNTSDDKTRYLKTNQSLLCLYRLEHKVPNKKINFSRFFLNKRLHTLRITNMFK